MVRNLCIWFSVYKQSKNLRCSRAGASIGLNPKLPQAVLGMYLYSALTAKEKFHAHGSHRSPEKAQEKVYSQLVEKHPPEAEPEGFISKAAAEGRQAG